VAGRISGDGVLLLIALLVGSALLSLGLLGLLIRSPLARHFADLPGHRKVHEVVIPRLGGTAIVLAFLVLLTIAQIFELWAPSTKLLLSIVFASLFLLIAGTLDDVLSLGYKAKFLLQFLLAGIVVSVFGLQFEAVSLFGTTYHLGGVGLILSIFWIVGLMNAVNIIDGIDGLAAGVSLVGFAGIGALSYAGGSPNPLGVSVALSGATIGFLYYNLQRRRKVFLGDTGSQFLGAMLGILTLRIHDLPSVGGSMLIPLLLVGYPILDTSVAMTRRFLQVRNKDIGQRVTRMFHADNDHMHHRLLFTGLSHIQATFLLLLLASGFAATAVVLPRLSWQWELGVLVYLIASVGFLLNRLGFLQSGTVRRAVRQWVFGGEVSRGRMASIYPRYYEIFSMADATAPVAATSVSDGAPDWALASRRHVADSARADSARHFSLVAREEDSRSSVLTRDL
jgi:UDP-GlcNAc:undecaprenyl-phosphate GlcNAc-1-phosphate transferase